MGTFHHGTDVEHVNDRDLALLQAVFDTKRDRREGFLATFVDAITEHTTAHWLSNESRVRFTFDEPGNRDIDAWHLDLQLAEAGSDTGMHVRAG